MELGTRCLFPLRFTLDPGKNCLVKVSQELSTRLIGNFGEPLVVYTLRYSDMAISTPCTVA